jgi:hypothetical protein
MSAADFRMGDVSSALGPMRLTVGGLAEIVARLETPDLPALAGRIREMSPPTARHVVAALLRPCGNAGRIESLTDAQIAPLMSAAARCITTALASRP